MIQIRTFNRYYITDPEYSLEDHFFLTTIPRPKIGDCTVHPLTGFAGKTSYTVRCKRFENDTHFEYYQINKNDETTMGN